jgi:hypothetical protein
MRTVLSFAIAAGPRQRSLSRVRVPWDLRPYFTASDSRIPFASPPTIRRVMVEVFDPASTRDKCQRQSQSQSYVTTDGSVGKSILEYNIDLGLKTRSLLLSDSCRLVDMGRSL